MKCQTIPWKCWMCICYRGCVRRLTLWPLTDVAMNSKHPHNCRFSERKSQTKPWFTVLQLSLTSCYICMPSQTWCNGMVAILWERWCRGDFGSLVVAAVLGKGSPYRKWADWASVLHDCKHCRLSHHPCLCICGNWKCVCVLVHTQWAVTAFFFNGTWR